MCDCGRPLKHTGRHWGPNSPRKSKPTGRAKLRLMVEQEIAASHATIVRLKNKISDCQSELSVVEAELGPLVRLLDAYRDMALPAPDMALPAPETAANPLVAGKSIFPEFDVNVPMPSGTAAPAAEPLADRLLAEMKGHAAPLPPPRAPLPPGVKMRSDFFSVPKPKPFKAEYRESYAGEVNEAAEAAYEPILANFGQVLKWAEVRGLPFKSWDDLPAVNRRREDFELPLFKRQMRANTK